MATYPKSIVNFNRTAGAINGLQKRIPIVTQSFTANGNVPIIRDNTPDEYRPPFSLKIGSYQGKPVVMAKRGAIRYTSVCLNTGTGFQFTETIEGSFANQYTLRHYGLHILQDISIVNRGIIILENTDPKTEFLQTEDPDWVILDWAQMPATPDPNGQGYYQYRLEYAIAYEPEILYGEKDKGLPEAHFALSIAGVGDSERALWCMGYINSEDGPVGIPLSYIDTSDKKHPYRDYGSNMDLTLFCYHNARFIDSEWGMISENNKIHENKSGYITSSVIENPIKPPVKTIICHPTPFGYESDMTYYNMDNEVA